MIMTKAFVVIVNDSDQHDATSVMGVFLNLDDAEQLKSDLESDFQNNGNDWATVDIQESTVS